MDPSLARPRRGPPPVSAPGHTVTYPQPREVQPKDLPPWHFVDPPPKAERPPPNPPTTLASLRDVENGSSRCDEGTRTRLYVLENATLTVDMEATAALAMQGSVEIQQEGRAPERALPLAALLGEGGTTTALELWPCTGDPVTLPIDVVRAEPERYVLVLSRHRGFKLLDRSLGRRPLLRNLAAIRIVP